MSVSPCLRVFSSVPPFFEYFTPLLHTPPSHPPFTSLLYFPSPDFANVPFLFGLQLALLTAYDFVQWFEFEVKTYVVLQLIFLAVTSVITFKT